VTAADAASLCAFGLAFVNRSEFTGLFTAAVADFERNNNPNKLKGIVLFITFCPNFISILVTPQSLLTIKSLGLIRLLVNQF
jgi:hypothetical protein